MVNSQDLQAAPGPLERVRELLNTWSTPGNARDPTDEFDIYIKTSGVQGPSEARRLRQLRDDLRGVVERSRDTDATLNTWLERLELRPEVSDETVGFRHQAGAAGEVLAIVLSAVQEGTWGRLKACSDCRWVFYDHTRNASKRWCQMTAGGPEGRSCGSIAKVKRYRARHKKAQVTT